MILVALLLRHVYLPPLLGHARRRPLALIAQVGATNRVQCHSPGTFGPGPAGPDPITVMGRKEAVASVQTAPVTEPVWARRPAELVELLGTDPARGLDDAEARARLAVTGPNELPETPPRPGGGGSPTA